MVVTVRHGVRQDLTGDPVDLHRCCRSFPKGAIRLVFVSASPDASKAVPSGTCALPPHIRDVHKEAWLRDCSALLSEQSPCIMLYCGAVYGTVK